MKCSRPALLLFVLFAIVASISGCMLGTQLNAETADPKTITGTYDLLLYGCRYPDDIEHAAFLIAPDKAGMVEFYVPATSYKVKRGLPADQALAEANAHVYVASARWRRSVFSGSRTAAAERSGSRSFPAIRPLI